MLVNPYSTFMVWFVPFLTNSVCAMVDFTVIIFLAIDIQSKGTGRTNPKDNYFCFVKERYLHCLPASEKCTLYINNKVYIKVNFTYTSFWNNFCINRNKNFSLGFHLDKLIFYKLPTISQLLYVFGWSQITVFFLMLF